MPHTVDRITTRSNVPGARTVRVNRPGGRTMVQAINRNATTTQDVFAVIADAGPIAPNEIAALLAISGVAAVAHAHDLVSAGFLDRDEFGRYANFCAWPRASL